MNYIPKDDQELLTPEQYADKLKIGRSTLFSWLSHGILIEGEHYFRIGRVIRFVWNSNALLKISAVKPTTRQQRTKPAPSHRHNIDWEY